LSDYNRQFLFDVPAAVYPAKPKLSLKQRLAKKTTFLTIGAAISVGALVGAAAGAGVGIGLYTYISKPAPVVVNNAANVTWVTAAAATASPSVVTINVSGSSGAGNGSGVVLSTDGYALTNAHVVTLDGSEASVKIEVKTFDGHIYSASVVGIDATNDLAVIKVDSPVAMIPIAFADSNKLNVGDEVVALGAPLGLSNTVTQGIVSALNRTIQVASSAAPENSDNGGGGLQFFSGSGNAINLRVIQTDAAINPGNSGGALVNQSGQLIGINVAIASAGSAGASGSIGVGFAIPANVAKRVADEIIKTGTASHGLLGAAVADAANSDNSASFSVGAEVKELTPGGAAEKGGLKVGDVVTKFNGSVVTSASELTAAVRQEPAGAKATVEFLRDGKVQSIQVTLGNSADLK
jgi:putative serine protease PepD